MNLYEPNPRRNIWENIEEINTRLITKSRNEGRIETYFENAFATKPVRKVKGKSRPTQRYLLINHFENNKEIWAEGGNELTAVLLLMHLQSLGVVRRFKFQPFNFYDLDEALEGVPDILVEMSNGRFYVVEVKARRYITAEVNEKLNQIDESLKSLGIDYLLWTDKDKYGRTNKLNQNVWRNVRTIHRGWLIGISRELVQCIFEKVKSEPITFSDLFGEFGWDLCIAAWARGAFHLKIQKEFDEKKILSPRYSSLDTAFFFSKNAIVGSWWGSLESVGSEILHEEMELNHE